jgi:hypothetical protein
VYWAQRGPDSGWSRTTSFIIGFRLHQEWEDRMSKQAAIARIGGVELSRAISETERRQRGELSAAFRVAAHLGWNGYAARRLFPIDNFHKERGGHIMLSHA